MVTERFLRYNKDIRLEQRERSRLEAAISEVQTIEARTTITREGEPLRHSTLLLEGLVSPYIDDRRGLRQLVALHVPGDFVDLHGFALKRLDHDVTTITAAKVAIIPHRELETIMRDFPGLTRKLWLATLIDAAIHRAWLFRLGRLDAVGRVAHFLCETNARLLSAGLSDGRRFVLELTQADLGEICGLTNVHINRVMRQLREEHLCVFRSAVVEMLDARRLAVRGQFDPSYLYTDDYLTGSEPPQLRISAWPNLPRASPKPEQAPPVRKTGMSYSTGPTGSL